MSKFPTDHESLERLRATFAKSASFPADPPDSRTAACFRRGILAVVEAINAASRPTEQFHVSPTGGCDIADSDGNIIGHAIDWRSAAAIVERMNRFALNVPAPTVAEAKPTHHPDAEVTMPAPGGTLGSAEYAALSGQLKALSVRIDWLHGRIDAFRESITSLESAVGILRRAVKRNPPTRRTKRGAK